MAVGQYLSLPGNSNGIVSTGRGVWIFGPVENFTYSIPTSISINFLTFQVANIPTVDIARQFLFEILIDGEVKLQIPYSIKADTVVGYFPKNCCVTLSEPYFVNFGSSISVRIADDNAGSLNYDGVKLFYIENSSPSVVINSPSNLEIFSTPTPTFNFTGTDPESDSLTYKVEITSPIVQVGNSLLVGSALVGGLAKLSSTRVAYSDSSLDVIRTYDFDGTNWSLVGNSLSIAGIGNPSISGLSSTQIAFIDSTNLQLRTYGFDGTDWSQVGNSLTLTGTVLPVVSSLTSTTVAVVDNTLKTLRTFSFDGTNWTQLGNSLTTETQGQPTITSLSSTRIVVFSSGQDLLVVYDFDGTDWVKVGSDLDIPSSGNSALATLTSTKIAFAEQISESLRTFEFVNDNYWVQVGPVLDLGNFNVPALVALSSTSVAYIGLNFDLLTNYRIPEVQTFTSGIDPGFTAGSPYASGVAINYTVQTPLLIDSLYNLRIAAIDSLNNGGWSTTTSFIISGAPTVSLDNPLNGATVTSTTPILSFTGTDVQLDDIQYKVEINDLVFPIPTIPFSDDFNDVSINLTRWKVLTGSGATVTQTGGQIVIQPVNNTINSYGTIIPIQYGDDARFNLTSLACVVNVPQVASSATGTVTTYMELSYANNNFQNQIVITHNNGNLLARKRINGSYTTVATVTYNSSTMSWWRIREESGITYWDYSGDNQTWTNFANQANPIEVINLIAGLACYENSSATTIVPANFDNFNIYNATITAISGTDSGFTGTPDNISPYPSGQQVSYTVQTPLSLITYYWRVAGIDPLGSNYYGSFSTIRSFTVSLPTGGNSNFFFFFR